MLEHDLVLVGGGHAHVLAIQALRMQAIDSVRVTLVSEQALTPYSGMLPGFVAGHYSKLDTLIDLPALCRECGVRWVCAEVIGLDPQAQRIHLKSGADLAYDLVSIDIGSKPDNRFPGAEEFATGVKPISQFHDRWDILLGQLERSSRDCNIGVVGAGVGGTELALALAYRLRSAPNCRIHLLFPHQSVMPGLPGRAQRIATAALQAMQVELHPGFRLLECQATGLLSTTGDFIALDRSFLCTSAAAAGWPQHSGLACDDAGFISVNEYLQSSSHNNVFAAGDIAHLQHSPRPKAGVYAVRQAPYLVDNWRRYFSGKSLRKADLQNDFLRLISLGERRAIAIRNGLVLKGDWIWRWKDAIDRKFMRQFADNGPMITEAGNSALMHCTGCGSKLGPELLESNLRALQQPLPAEFAHGLERSEDAVSWSPGESLTLLQSIDGLRSFIDDHYRFGRIATEHSLNDVFAMGAAPVHALLWANLAFAHPRLQQRDHLRLICGVRDSLHAAGAVLSGGHSSEGPEDHIAVVANALSQGESMWRKQGAQAGDCLVVNKALGTGVILAASMQGRHCGYALQQAVDQMNRSNRSFFEQLRQRETHAVTDISGFGLLGHLQEMLPNGTLQVSLFAHQIPLLPEVLSLARAGVEPSLLPALRPLLEQCCFAADLDAAWQTILLDPQTSGPLLAAVAPDVARSLVAADENVKIIGTIQAATAEGPAILVYTEEGKE